MLFPRLNVPQDEEEKPSPRVHRKNPERVYIENPQAPQVKNERLINLMYSVLHNTEHFQAHELHNLHHVLDRVRREAKFKGVIGFEVRHYQSEGQHHFRFNIDIPEREET